MNILRKSTSQVFRCLRQNGGQILGAKRFLPICTIDTNMKAVEIPSDLHTGFLSLVATTLNKPEKLVTVSVRSDLMISRGLTDDPVVSAHIWSLGVFDEKRNPTYSKIFIEFLMNKLNVPSDRVTVLLHDIEKKDACHLLYADMLAGK